MESTCPMEQSSRGDQIYVILGVFSRQNENPAQSKDVEAANLGPDHIKVKTLVKTKLKTKFISESNTIAI